MNCPRFCSFSFTSGEQACAQHAHHCNYPLPLEVWVIPYRSPTLLKTWAFSWTVPSHPQSIPEAFIIWRSFAELFVLVQLHLECAMQACSPNLVANIDSFEWIQRLATRLVKGFHRLPYEERLHRVGLHSLNGRRLRGDIRFGHNMFSGELGLDLGLSFIPPVRPGLRRHTFKVLQDRRLRQKSFFSIRVINAWTGSALLL